MSRLLQFFRKISTFSSGKKGAKIVFATWILAVVILSMFAPSAKDYEGSSGEGSKNENMPSEIAEDVLQAHFPSDEGLPALLVFHQDTEITTEDKDKITTFSKWLASDERPNEITSTLPYHEFPEEVQKQMYSEDGTTLLFNVTLEEGLEASAANEVMDEIRSKVEELVLNELQFEITGPA